MRTFDDSFAAQLNVSASNCINSDERECTKKSRSPQAALAFGRHWGSSFTSQGSRSTKRQGRA